MPLALQQVQKLSQRLIMTPQMQQSIKLLQLNTIELDQLTEQEILENPFLEIAEDEEGLPGAEVEPGPDGEESNVIKAEPDDPATGDAELDDTYATTPGASETTLETDGDPLQESAAADDAGGITEGVDANALEDQPEQFSESDTDWEEVFNDAPMGRLRLSAPDEGDERSMEETVASRTSLYDMLDWQLRVSSLEGKDAEIGAYLIGCIDDDGYLRESLEACAELFGVMLAQVERVLSVIQEFDPTGVGARDLPECLRLQLEALGRLTPLARQMLDGHWTDLTRKKFKDVARALKTDEKNVLGVLAWIRSLNPAPGRVYTKEQPQYIRPDVYVKEMDGKYACYLYEGQVSNLRLNNTYKDILIKGRDGGQAREEYDYALDKYRSAVMFIKNIEKRRSTILRVTEAIMEYQEEFLRDGVEALRPLSLAEIATTVGMHESTISRVTSHKYVDTPQGLFELKYFFSSASQSDRGEAASSRSIRQKIRGLIEKEDPRRPLSDDKIATILGNQGFTIARRTVAKYREQMKILRTNLRRAND